MDAAPTPDQTRWYLVVEFIGLDLNDDNVLDALVADPSLHIMWSSTEGVTTAEATIVGESAQDAIDTILEVVRAAAPGAAPLRLIDPLVAVSDIADDAGVSRQAVRNWALGTRKSGFPRSIAVVGDGIRIWRLAEVDEWLTAAVNLGRGYRFPSPTFVASYNDRVVTNRADDDWQAADELSSYQDSSSVRTPASKAARVLSTRDR